MGTAHDFSFTVVSHSLGHVDCPACARSRALTLARIAPDLPFSQAAALWLDSRSFRAAPNAISARYIRESTETSYRQYVSSLELFFGQLPLDKIHLGHLRQYQEARVTGAAPFIRKRRPNKNVVAAPCPAGPKKANQELSILKMILRRAGCWTQEMDEFYERFEERPSEVQRALTAEEQQRWLDVAMFKERWHIVYWYSVLAFDTSMSTNEIRALRLGDVNMIQRVVNVSQRGAKNRYRQRTIPIQSADALWALEQLILRARELGAIAPQHFLFPYRRPPGPWDATQPMSVSGIKRQWNEVRSACRFDGKDGRPSFRPYDTRHTALTRWAENGVPPEVARARAGHMGDVMMGNYVHIYEAVQRKWFASSMHQTDPSITTRPFYVARRA